MAVETETEEICRYCFDGEDEDPLISPCKCSGGQKYVHLKCLRRWQRMVLVTQPTHPAYHDRDLRHQTCNVCKSEFTCSPPTRLELMTSFTGPEMAALIDEGCVIASHEAFATELETQLQTMPALLRHSSGYDHWIRGMFLITKVEEDDGRLTLEVTNASMMEAIKGKLDSQLRMSLQGRRFKVDAAEALAGVPQDRLAEAFESLSVPCSIAFTADEPSHCGNDSIYAVNLTRVLAQPPKPREVREALARVCSKYSGAARVELAHFIGGPCDEDDLMACVVLGGGGRGWTVLKDLDAAVELAHTRAARRCEEQGQIAGGQTVRLRGLKSATHLNGQIGLALRFVDGGRWLVRLCDGDGKRLKPENLEPLEGANGRVFVVWGDARWSRQQLLGEIAKGDWGLCRANISDLTSAATQRWTNMDGRLVFAPITEMTESYMRQAQQQMQQARVQVQMHSPPQPDEE